MTLIIGIDEAGRGPVIGPMVMCGILIDDKDESKLKKIGVKDSKLLSPRQRADLSKKIKRTVIKYKVLIIGPGEIDKAVESDIDNLNWLEAKKTAELLNELKPGAAYLDCPSNNIRAYSDFIKNKLSNKKLKIIAEHKADLKYPAVSAASIIAKDTRDREIEKLKKKYKVEFGSGYPSDPRTIDFLDKNYKKYPFFRKSWASWKTVAKKKGQSKLVNF